MSTERRTLATFSVVKLLVIILFFAGVSAALLALRDVPYQGRRYSAQSAATIINLLLFVIAIYAPILITKLLFAVRRQSAVFVEDGILRAFPWGVRATPLADIASVHDEQTNVWTGNVVIVLRDGRRMQFATREYAIQADDLARDINVTLSAPTQL
ncbi:hypothetical protein ASG17_09400 [Brevundimonas sp. Leaf363]|uniref:hypothetical protein n=1 Tax=Brevundimonas sp. Leaf363 TaxID=1736353 RepID=UPI0006F4E214|nr:hypothetical protein [Brevundimonas sp. Leaf363]KQS56223.1 hypothetical protein ASG17_09400 [Brevundimonas sp. Leaf363]